MLTLCIRTDNPEAELYLYDDTVKLAGSTWAAHRKLAETLHNKIEELLTSQGKSLQEIEKICVYQGPGSFTGLRIGLSVANTLSYAFDVPIIGAEGESWLQDSLKSTVVNREPVAALYGSDPHITKQKK